jgi:hypothetical protein
MHGIRRLAAIADPLAEAAMAATIQDLRKEWA